ncbi:hypothetical protein DFS34DRAFT_695482 [Phlyctochytrium arcticum]|nr:hypothetical protein DFS34DRAFT_695482 [Phlyctochytrium arcticum]
MACSECSRNRVGERVPDKWEDLKDNHQHNCVFLHMLGKAGRAKVGYLQWYDGWDMASANESDKLLVASLFAQIQVDITRSFGDDG